tara:strand:+ start:1686 stop:2345 length:660 start_codon:yes stop_codon:yes gene_type:complete
MSYEDQQLINFQFEKNYKKDDFYVSKSNFFAFSLLDSWPKWEKNIINIHGEKYSGKTHLSQIFIKKNKGIIIPAINFEPGFENKLRFHQNIILDDFNTQVNENTIFSLINFVDQNSKYLIINSQLPFNKMKFKLKDLLSRARNCLDAKIEKPDDELVKVLISKILFDKQIKINNKLVEFAAKRIRRSYGKIFEFIYKIDEISLKKKKSIDQKTIKEALG